MSLVAWREGVASSCLNIFTSGLFNLWGSGVGGPAGTRTGAQCGTSPTVLGMSRAMVYLEDVPIHFQLSTFPFCTISTAFQWWVCFAMGWMIDTASSYSCSISTHFVLLLLVVVDVLCPPVMDLLLQYRKNTVIIVGKLKFPCCVLVTSLPPPHSILGLIMWCSSDGNCTTCRESKFLLHHHVGPMSCYLPTILSIGRWKMTVLQH